MLVAIRENAGDPEVVFTFEMQFSKSDNDSFEEWIEVEMLFERKRNSKRSDASIEV